MCFTHHRLLHQAAMQGSAHASDTEPSAGYSVATPGATEQPSDPEFAAISDLEPASGEPTGAEVGLHA